MEKIKVELFSIKFKNMAKRKVNLEKIKEILEDRGYKNGEVPRGWEVHHIKPLTEGGKDTRKNIIVIPRKKHQQIHKNRKERGEK